MPETPENQDFKAERERAGEHEVPVLRTIVGQGVSRRVGLVRLCIDDALHRSDNDDDSGYGSSGRCL